MSNKKDDEHFVTTMIRFLSDVTAKGVEDAKLKAVTSSSKRSVINHANKYGRDDKNANAKWFHEACSDGEVDLAIAIINGLKMDFVELEKAFASLDEDTGVAVERFIKFLVFMGVDPDMQDYKLMVFALTHYDTATIDALLDVGAKINTPSILKQIEPYLNNEKARGFYEDYGLLE